MPFTPFIGLSIVVHILLILFYKMFSLLPNIPFPRPFRRERLWLGMLIIASVFSFVLVSAAVMVRVSVSEEHSSVRFFTRQFQAFTAITNAQGETSAIPPAKLRDQTEPVNQYVSIPVWRVVQ